MDEQDEAPPKINDPHYEQALRALYRVTGQKRTICEVHRCLYDEIEKLPDGPAKDRMVQGVEEAFLLGKKMDTKLRQYQGKHPDWWYEQEKPDAVSARRELRSKRT